MTSPAFQFYPSDFLADEHVALMSNQELGCYIKLICYCWREGSIPSDVNKIGRLCGESNMELLWPSIAPCFNGPELNGRLTHPRLQKEKEKQDQRRLINTQHGKIGGANKWGIDATDINKIKRSERLANARKLARHTEIEWKALLSICDNKCLRCKSTSNKIVKDHIVPIYQGGSDGIDNLQPICSSCNSSKGPDTTDYRPVGWRDKMPGECLALQSSSSTTDIYNPIVPSLFDQFWNLYPNHTAKKKAKQIWDKINPQNGTFESIMDGLKKQIEWRESVKGKDVFVPEWPHPATWLNNERWTDEVALPQQQGSSGYKFFHDQKEDA